MRRLLFLAAVSVACSPKLELPASATVSCAGGNVCPDGYVCVNNQRCVAPAVIDAQGVSPIVPAADSLWPASADIAFAWSTVNGARAYTLEIATDDPPAHYVAATPLSLAGTTTTVQLPVGTYYWRVTSDITDMSAAQTVSRFGVLDGAVYVDCTADTDCGIDAQRPELGTPQLPYRSINRGITAALSSGVSAVRVAVRDSGQAYGETVSLQNGIDVVGGYEPTFAMQSGLTSVTTADVALYAVDITAPTTVDHFSFTTTGTTASSCVARLIADTDALTLSNVTLRASMIHDDVLRVESTPTGEGPKLISSTVEGENLGEPVSDSFHAITVRSAALQLDTTTVSMTFDTIGATVNLIDADASRLTITESVVRSSGGQHASQVQGVRALGGPLTVRGSEITVGAAATTQSFGIVAGSGTASLTVDSSVVDVSGVSAECVADVEGGGPIAITDNTLRGRAAFVTGFSIEENTASHSGRIVGNLIEVVSHASGAGDGLAWAIALPHSQPVALTIAHNTIVVGGDSTDNRAGINSSEAAVRIVDNAFVMTSSSCTGACFAVSAGDASASNPDIYTLAFTGNAVVGFRAGCGYIQCASDPGCCLDVAGTGIAATPHAYWAGNTTPSDGGFVSLLGPDGLTATADDDLHLTAASHLRGAGHDSTADDCRASANDANAPAPACGNVTTDHDGIAFSAPQSIGAYENITH